MITLIEMAYLYYWWATFTKSMEDAKTYRQRLVVSAAMVGFLLVVGHYASKELGAVLCGWALTVEIASFVLAVLDLDERLFPRKART